MQPGAAWSRASFAAREIVGRSEERRAVSALARTELFVRAGPTNYQHVLVIVEPLTHLPSVRNEPEPGAGELFGCGKVRTTKTALESNFVDLLLDVQPSEGYLRLFREIVLDVWNQRRSDASRLRQEVQLRADRLRRRLDRVEEAFLYDQSIDRQSYERQRDKLRSDIVLAELEAGDAKSDEIDVEELLAFAEGALTKIALLWNEAPVDRKRRLQSLIFPEGLEFDGRSFGTARTCLAFTTLGASSNHESGVASPTGSHRPYRVISGPCAA
jgi:hypothetical protein